MDFQWSTDNVAEFWSTQDGVYRRDCVLEVDNQEKTVSILKGGKRIISRALGPSDIEQVQYGPNSGFLCIWVKANVLGQDRQQLIMDVKPDAGAKAVARFIKSWNGWDKVGITLSSKKEKEELFGRHKESLKHSGLDRHSMSPAAERSSERASSSVMDTQELATPARQPSDLFSEPAGNSHRLSQSGELTPSNKRKRLEACETRYQELFEDVKSLKSRLVGTRDTGLAQLAELDNLKDEDNRLRTEVEEEKTKAVGLQELKTIRIKNENLLEENDVLMVKNSRLENELDFCKQQRNELKAQCDALEAAQARMKTEAEALKKEEKSITAEKEALKDWRASVSRFWTSMRS